MQCQGQRGVLEIRFANTGTFMFHAHQSEFTELGWMGYFRWRRRQSHGGPGAVGGSLGWRVWALVPVVLLAVAVAFVVAGRPGRRPPRRLAAAADEFDVRRVEFRKGEIRIQVRNPQRDDLTIASVTVDDAIVPFTLDGPSTLGRLQSSTVVVPYDWVERSRSRSASRARPASRRSRRSAAVLTPQPSAREFLGYGLIRPSSASSRSRSACSGCRRPATCWRATLARCVHGPDRGPADVSRRGGACRGARAAGRSALGARGCRDRAARRRHERARDDVPVHTAVARRRGRDGLALALLVALGIGVHNLGEGLAIGTSFATGELQLGAFLGQSAS